MAIRSFELPQGASLSNMRENREMNSRSVVRTPRTSRTRMALELLTSSFKGFHAAVFTDRV